jgi:phosphoribosylformylglycinamidine synthase
LGLASDQTEQRWDRVLFGEGGARILVSVNPLQRDGWETYLQHQLQGEWQLLGQVGGAHLTLISGDGPVVIQALVEQMKQTWQNAIATQLTA